MESSDEALARDLLRSIRRIVRSVSLRSRELARETGLTVPQLVCLRAVAEAGAPPTLRQLARLVELSPATVTGIADRLERAGLVERRRLDADRRKIRLVLTPAGEARALDLPPALHERFLARVAALPEGERQTLQDSLDRVVELMEARGLDAAPMLVDGVSVGEPQD